MPRIATAFGSLVHNDKFCWRGFLWVKRTETVADVVGVLTSERVFLPTDIVYVEAPITTKVADCWDLKYMPHDGSYVAVFTDPDTNGKTEVQLEIVETPIPCSICNDTDDRECGHFDPKYWGPSAKE